MQIQALNRERVLAEIIAERDMEILQLATENARQAKEIKDLKAKMESKKEE